MEEIAGKISKRFYKMATLFSGAGGLDSGFIKTGNFKTLLANDILFAPAETYSKNYHHKVIEVEKFNSNTKFPVYLVGDISKINFDPLPKLDCVVGGPPCQDFSITRGKTERKGIQVTRGKLYSHFVRALTKTQPKVFIFENVPGLKSANKGVAYETITNDFTKLHVRWNNIKEELHSKAESPKNYALVFNKVVDAVNVGVPQRRRRLIIIGTREDLLEKGIKNGKLLNFKESAEDVLEGKHSLAGKYPLTTLETFEGKTIPQLQKEYEEVMNDYTGVAEKVGTKVALKWKENVWDSLTSDIVDDYLTANEIHNYSVDEINKAFKEHEKILKELDFYGKKLEGRKFADESNKLPKEKESVISRMQMIPPNMNSGFVNGTKWNVESRGMSHIYRRVHPLKPAYTVLAYGGGGTWSYHYKRERGRLTNRERARLQTFSDDYMFEGNTSEVRAQIGEAVPVRLGQKLAEIAEIVLDKTKK